MIRKNFDITQATYGSYGCSVTNRTQFYSFMLRYVTLRIDMYGSTLRYGFLRYVTWGCKTGISRAQCTKHATETSV